MEFEFGDVVTVVGVRHLVLGVVVHSFTIDDLAITSEDSENELCAKTGSVILMSLETAHKTLPFGFIDAFRAESIKKED